VSVLDYPVWLLEAVVNESVVSHALLWTAITSLMLTTLSSFGESRSNTPVHGLSPMMSNHFSRLYLTIAPPHQHTRPIVIERYFR
jgi:hypothetical protein